MRADLWMSRLRTIFRRIGGFFAARRLDAEFQQELSTHLSMLDEENLRRGLAPEEARRQARLRLGADAPLRETQHDLRGLPWLDTLVQDVRFGLRMLRKSPGFTSLAILTLALGIGANTAFFSVIDAVLLRSLPFRDASRLAAISETHPATPNLGASIADFDDWKAQAHSFQGLAGYDPTTLAHSALMAHGQSDEIQVAIVTHNLFPLLGIQPHVGRNFFPQEDTLGKGRVAILSNRVWKNAFGARPGIVGSSITMNGKAYAVVGVLPAGVRFPENADVWLPLGTLDKEDRTNRFYHPLFVIGRLRTGRTLSEARSELAAIAEQLARAYPQTNHKIGIRLRPLLETTVGGLRRYFLLLWTAVVLVLLIACANVASLLLVRATTRKREMALRSAFGADRVRLFRQVLTESILLSVLGGMGAIVFAVPTVSALAKWLPRALDVPILRLHEIRINPAVFGMTLGISLVSAVIFGLLPALNAGRRNDDSLFRANQPSSDPGSWRFTCRLVVGAQVALSVMLLVCAGLLARSLQNLLATSPGFLTHNLVTMRLALPGNKYRSRQAVEDFYRRLFPQIRALPGVESVGTIDQTPFHPNLAVTRFLVDGAAPVRPGDYPVADYRLVSPGYFHTMGIPLLHGRVLIEADLVHAPVVLINRTLADEYFASHNPVGRKLLLGVATGRPYAIPIVGIVDDVRDISVASPPPAEMYFAGFGQVSTLVVRSTATPSAAARAIRGAVLAADSSVAVFRARTGSQLVDHSIARQRFAATLLALFAALALLLSVGGIYGVTSYAVVGRTQEIGMRTAVGAQRGDILRLVFRQEMIAPALGTVTGVAGAFGATKLLSRLLYRVGAVDPVTFGAVCLVIAGSAALACYIPARRASRRDPMVALRHP